MSNSMNGSQRNIADANLQIVTALPAAAATVDSDSIDLVQVGNLAAVEGAELRLTVPATPSLANGKKVTLTIQDSADDSTFVAVSQLAAQEITGGVSGGGAALDVRFKIPSTARRYIGVNIAVESSGGDNTAISATLSLLT